MKILTGIDIIEISRINEKLTISNSSFKNFFTEKEIDYASNKPNKYASYAGIFSAKEACFKAFSKILKVHLNDFEILHNKNTPYLNIKNEDIKKYNIISYDISISHNNEHATSICTILLEEKNGNI